MPGKAYSPARADYRAGEKEKDMAITKFYKDGNKVEVLPIMEGGMNCGYTINAFAPGTDDVIKTVQGSKSNPKALVFENADEIAENTTIQVTFQFRAGNDALVNSPYTIGLVAEQNNTKLSEKATKNGKLPKAVKTSQLSLILVSAPIDSPLIEEA